MATFKSNLNQAAVNYQFLEYENATHAFTNPGATEKGKQFNMPISYNEAADQKSWMDMQRFLAEVLK